MILVNIKCYNNYLLFLFLNTKNGEINAFEFSDHYNDIMALLAFMKNNNQSYFVGFNMEKFNNIILNHILMNYQQISKDNAKTIIYNINILIQDILSSNYDSQLKYQTFFRTIDLLKYVTNSSINISFNDIKAYYGHMNNENFSKSVITKDSILKVKEQSKNDLITLLKLLNDVNPKIKQRMKLGKELGINILNKYKESIGNNVILSHYLKLYNVKLDNMIQLKSKEKKELRQVKDLIYKDYRFQNSYIKQYYEQLLNSDTKKDYLTDFSVKTENIIINKNLNKKMIDNIYEEDCYVINIKILPTLIMIKNKIYPDFLDEDFINVLSNYYNNLLIAIKTNNKESIEFNSNILENIVDNMSVPSSFTESHYTQNIIFMNYILEILNCIDNVLINSEILSIDKDFIIIKEKDLVHFQSLINIGLQFFKCNKVVYIDSKNYLFALDGYDKNAEFDTPLYDKCFIEKGCFKTKNYIGNLNPIIISKLFHIFFIKNESIKNYIDNNNNLKDYLFIYKRNRTNTLILDDEIVDNFIKIYYSNNGCILKKISEGKSENAFNEKVAMFFEDLPINKKEYLKYFLNFKNKIIKERKLF